MAILFFDSAAEAVMKGQADSILLFHQQNVPHSKLEQVSHLFFFFSAKLIKPHGSKSVFHIKDHRCKLCGKGFCICLVILISDASLFLFLSVTSSDCCKKTTKKNLEGCVVLLIVWYQQTAKLQVRR